MNFRKNKYASQLKAELPNVIAFAKSFAKTPDFDDGLSILDHITVVFDDVNKPFIESNVKQTLEEIKRLTNKLRKLTDDSDAERVSEHLIEILEKENFDDYSAEGIYCRIKRLMEDANPEVSKLAAELMDVISGISIGRNIAGKFDIGKKQITLYCLNIADTVEDYISVFAHEVFHALHFGYFELENPELIDRYYHKVVLESLAAAFQYEYLCTKGVEYKKIADDLLVSIEKNTPVLYPYSGAKYFLLKGYYVNADVLSVLKATRYKDFVIALRELISNKYEFELILLKKLDKVSIQVIQPVVLTSKDKASTLTISNKADLNNPTGICEPVTFMKGVPVYLIPHDFEIFRGYYRAGYKMVYQVNYKDGHVMFIGPCSNSRGGEVKDVGYLTTNNKLRNSLLGATSVLIYILL